MSFDVRRIMRQLEIIPPEKLGQQITIVGAGAIGSMTALSLAKMGFGNLTVFDMDRVEPENMNCQFFRHSDAGKPKVLALMDLIHDFTEFKITPREELYEKGVFPGIVISAVDNMKTRRAIWENHLKSPHTQYVIDPRMGAETALLFCMNPNDEKDRASYEKSLYHDDDAVQERCTAKSTMYTASMLSGLVAKTVKDIVTNGKVCRTAQWAIADNQFVAWQKEVVNG